MSLRLALLNTALRFGEKRRLARVSDPVELRRIADFKARLMLRAPRGTCIRCEPLEGQELYWITAPGASDNKVILYLHGGGYMFGSLHTHRAVMGHLSRLTGCVVAMPDYRLAPEHPFPAAFDDALLAYDHLRKAGYTSQQIVIGGDSAGGGLSLALLGQLLARGGDRPAGVFAFSPLTDMSFSSPSMVENARRDVLLPAARSQECADFYLDGLPSDDPRVSPVYADMEGAPPVYLAVSKREILRDDTLRMEERLRKRGVSVVLELHDAAPHAWPVFHGLIPEAEATLTNLARWIKTLWRTEDES